MIHQSSVGILIVVDAILAEQIKDVHKKVDPCVIPEPEAFLQPQVKVGEGLNPVRASFLGSDHSKALLNTKIRRKVNPFEGSRPVASREVLEVGADDEI